MNKHRPKHNFTDRDLDRVLLTLWTRDDLIFIPSDIESRSPSLYICTTGPGPESVHSTRGKEAAPDKSKTDFVRSLYLLILERSPRSENGRRLCLKSRPRYSRPYRTSILYTYKISSFSTSLSRAPSTGLIPSSAISFQWIGKRSPTRTYMRIDI